MQSLFFKIFLWFCLIVVLVGTLLETSSILANVYEERWQIMLHGIMPMEAEKSARIFETSGKQSLQDYLDELQKQKSVRFYFFDEDGTPLLDRGAPKFTWPGERTFRFTNLTSPASEASSTDLPRV